MTEKPAETTSTALAAAPTAGHADIAEFRAILIVAGVSGSGKTTIATALAQRLGLPFAEGGQLHPPPDIAKLHSAHPLDDRAQWSWLEKIAAWIDGCRQSGTGGVITSPAQPPRFPDLSFPKIPSELNWHDEVESLHRQWRCLRSFMHSGCSSPTCSSRVLGLKPRTSFSVIS
jgi:hypothetical protein